MCGSTVFKLNAGNNLVEVEAVIMMIDDDDDDDSSIVDAGFGFSFTL